MIDVKWSGAIPATIIVNNNTGYRKFTEDQISAADLEKYLKMERRALIEVRLYMH